MDMTIDQQVALDEALVPHASRLRIGKSNFRLRSDITSKESTLQVVYDVLILTPFYKAFLVTADVLEIYMQEFWATATVHHHVIRFKMNNKKRIVNLEYFKEMLHICPRIPNQTFDELPHQNTQQFGAILPVELINEDIRNSAGYKEYHAIASGAAPPKTKASTRLLTSAKGKLPAKSSKAKGLSVLSEVALTEAEQMKLATKRSLQQTYISQASGSGADKGTGQDAEDNDEELYRDGNINLEGRDVQMTDSSSVSSQFVLNMLNPSPDAGIDSLFESTPQVNVPVSTTVVPLLVTAPTLLPLSIPIILQAQQAPAPSPATAPSSSLANRSDEQRNLYKALVDAYECEKIILDTYGDMVMLKRRRGDEGKDEEPSAGSDWGVLEKTSSPTYELMKGSCKSLVKLEFFLEEVYKATTDQLDWNNPEGQQESARNVKRRIIAVTELQIVEWHNYKHLDWIIVHRDDEKLYKFKEGNLKRLHIQDIEGMLLLLPESKGSTQGYPLVSVEVFRNIELLYGIEDNHHVPSDAMHNPSQPLKVRKTLFQNSRRFTHFYRLSDSELAGRSSRIRRILKDGGEGTCFQLSQRFIATCSYLTNNEEVLKLKNFKKDASKGFQVIKSRKDCTLMSSAEAENVSLSAYYAQVLWMRTQLTDYDFHFDKIPMYCDSKAAISISCNPVQHSRTKHIDVRYHFIKEKVEKGIVELFFVGTEYQLADLFTKALPKDRFKYLVRRLGMRCLTPEELEVLANKSA
nr:retrovirus-related Pol polyprotein from transposon TNT 1-94 [Tanacetum cinerariifolium]